MNSRLLGALAVSMLAAQLQAQSVDTLVSSNLFEPHGVATDTNGNLFITDGGSGNRVVEYTQNGNLIVFAGQTGTAGTNDGPGAQARFNNPQGITYARGGLFVADSENQTIRFIDINRNVTTVAGRVGMSDDMIDGGLGVSQFSYPAGLAADTNGNVYVADFGNGAIRKLDNSNVVSTVVSNGIGWPSAVAVGTNGDLWVADSHNHVIYRVDQSGGITRMAGIPGNLGTNDSLFATQARLNGPRGLLWTKSGLIISDTGNNTIRRLYYNGASDVMTNSLVTVAGVPGIAGATDAAALGATMNSPIGLAPDIYTSGFCIADSANKVIRRYRSTSQPVVPVSAPKIGWVKFVADQSGTITSQFIDVTDTSSVFNNTQIIAIQAEDGTETLFSFGPTPTDAFEDTVADPSIAGQTPPYLYLGDGLTKPECAPTILGPAPTLTIKAMSQQDGRPPSSVVRSDFVFKVGKPVFGGNNTASLQLNDATDGASLYYTLNGDDPIESSAFCHGPYLPGEIVSFNLESNAVMKVRGFKAGFQPSEVSAQTLYPSNYVANRITFGFESGEASSQFVGVAGRRFFAPVTLSLMPGQKMYSLQFNVTVTNLNVAPAVFPSFDFTSMLMKPDPTNAELLVPIDPMMFDTGSGTMKSLLIPNPSLNLLGIGWLERYKYTNLYNTLNQDLIQMSQAHDKTYYQDGGAVIVGSYSFVVPNNAPDNSLYQIQIGRPSATADGISKDVLMQTPITGSLSNGAINSIKNVTVKSQQMYLVGDVTPFRWFNAGDFGDGAIKNNDVLQVFQSASYGLNTPPVGCDMYDSMDSSDGNVNGQYSTDASIDTVVKGDGQLNIDDVYVTFRRSIDPQLAWYMRYWSNGLPVPVKVLNSVPGGGLRAVATAMPVVAAAPTGVAQPLIRIPASDLQIAPGGIPTVQVPITAQILGDYPIRTFLANISVQPLDGAPAITNAITFKESAALTTTSKLADSRGANNLSLAYLDASVPGVTGTNVIGILTITLPGNVSSSAAYVVHFDRFSASPNGLGLFKTSVEDTLITFADRSASSWNDGIPDSWRLRNFGTVSNLLSAANADPDGDGVSNLQEYVAGTNPQDVASKLQLLSNGKTNSSNFKLQWPTVANKQYVIECAPSLFGTNWTVLSTNLIGDGQVQEFIDTNAASGLKFYRIRVAQ